ncbi:uncharacterized protein LOC124358424 [Homalodisca vitripennis]|uniref:uncharacterized protein LOC124358424 n=1 Tax=Homalodisca vitripennis TaxID=197043 RepID=UPI001EEBB02B|nr:uncharacterized protein LOC124358424 [Homalodisca vitripennis]
MLPYFNGSSLLVHFTTVAQNIGQRFRALNVKIKEVVTRKNVVRWRDRCQGDLYTVPFDGNNTFACDMETLMSTYWLLCDAVHHANVFYSHQLLAVISFLLVNITCNLYYSYLEIGGNILDLCNLLLWSSAQILYLVWMITSSTSVSEAADEIKPLIFELINIEDDLSHKQELKMFVLRLETYRPRFTAFDIFEVNNQTLTTMAGLVMTYLVILIQFRQDKSD